MSGRRKLVWLLADGLRDDTARQYMGYLTALLEHGRAVASTLRCELPSLSRPLYGTLLNGQPPLNHGILSNQQAGLRLEGTVFDALEGSGKTACLAAYHWFFELLAGRTFDPLADRSARPPQTAVQGARWYWEDDYPDSHLLADADELRLAHAPDLLFIHPMGPDHAGHMHGADTAGYALAARRLDHLLSLWLPRWQAAGYELLLCSDHGMNADRLHGGPLDAERLVPLVWVPQPTHPTQVASTPPAWPQDQTGIAALVLSRLGLEL